MSDMLETIRLRLRNRADTEHVQAFIRVVITGLVAAYLNLNIGERTELSQWGDWIATGYFVISPLFVVWIILNPRPLKYRRYLAMLMEHSLLTACLALEGERAAPLFLIYVWVSLGNGFRYGVRPLLWSTVISAIGFCDVIVFSHFWQSILPVSIGLLIMLIAIPCYAATLVRQLHAAKMAAESANLAKSRFLAIASHELRTPLHAIIGLSDLLQHTSLSHDQSEMIQTVRGSGRALLSLVEDVLDLSSIQAGRLNSDNEDFELYKKVAETISIARPQAARKNLNLTVCISPLVPSQLSGDWRHLRQILLNLITNAIKFTDHGSITLTIEPVTVSRGDVRLRFAVTDTGIGISEKDLQHIFETFVQSNTSSTRKHGGVGLGLAIVRQLVDLLQGEINVSSELGKGSVFTAELPFVRFEDATRLLPEGLVAVYSDNTQLLQQVRAIHQGVVVAGMPATEVMANLPVVALIDGRGLSPADSAALADRVARDLQSVAASLILLSNDAPDLAGQQNFATTMRSINDLPVALHIGFDLAAHRDVAEALKTHDHEVISLDRPVSMTSGNANGRRVLVVEDSPVNRMVTSKILNSGGYQVILAEAAETALELMVDEEFDVILLDLNLPGTSGVDIVKLYKLMRLGQTMPPIVVFSADVTEEARAECVELGVALFLPKPSGPHYMLASLAKLVPAAEIAEQAYPTPQTVAEISSHPRYRATPELGVIDREAMENLSNLDSSNGFLNELLDAFETDTADILDALDASVRNRDMLAFWDHIHAMRSSAANVGARQIFATCIDINSNGKMSFHARGPEYAARLRHEYLRFERAVHRVFAAQEKGRMRDA